MLLPYMLPISNIGDLYIILPLLNMQIVIGTCRGAIDIGLEISVHYCIM
jgi:hypothetical protein